MARTNKNGLSKSSSAKVVKYPITLRGRTFSKSDIKVISDCALKFFDYGRTRISVETCKKLRWKQPNGWLKDRACREVLVRLAELKVIRLPLPVRGSHNKKQGADRKRKTRFIYKPIVFSNDISLDFAKGNQAEQQWNALVANHHYLGHKVVVGRSIKYLVKYREETVGAICFSSPAWRLEPRDRVLGSLGLSADTIRHCVISNSRFLILEQKIERNLASRILSAATRQVARDWKEFYSVEPKVVETFVQPSRFKGTCYKAANWHRIGLTKGYAKRGHGHVNSQEPKQVFLYGLSKPFRRKMLRVIKDLKDQAEVGL